MKREDVTFLIIAQNEEARIERAIRSCIGVGHVLVIDGGSTDSTVRLAESLGAKVLTNPYVHSARQYNYGLDRIATPWAFVLDADERLGASMAAAVAELEPPTTIVGYWTRRLNYLFGAPIRHSGWTPDLNVRLVRVDSCRYDDRPVHARMIANGELGNLDGTLHHFTYKSVAQYIDKLQSYTDLEVEARAQKQEVLDARSRARALYLRLPFKSSVRFIYMYIIRRGFLDGRRGFDLARLSAFYETVVSLKTRYASDSQGDDEPTLYP